MKLFAVSTMLGSALLLAGCASNSENAGKVQEKAPEIGVITSAEQTQVVTEGIAIGNKVLEALSKNDYSLLENLAIGNAQNTFTQERFAKLMEKVQEQGGIVRYSYLGDLSMYPYHRLLWKVTFQNLEKKEEAAAMDVLFELHMAKVGSSFRSVGFGFRQ